MATALLAGWGNSEFTAGLLSVVKSYLLAEGLLEGRSLVHRCSRLRFQWVCLSTVKYQVSKGTEGLSFSGELVVAHDFVPTALICHQPLSVN